MSDYGDEYGDDYGDSQDWLYVEDHYDEADNLAEHTCPSPVFFISIEEDYDDYDPYDYWEDLAYLSDSYHDANTTSGLKSHEEQRTSATTPSQTRPKKKRRKEERKQLKDAIPRRRGSIPEPWPPVVWIPSQARDPIAVRQAETGVKSGNKVVALLKDWQERFKNTPGLTTRPPKEDEEMQGDGFSLDIQSIAGLLSSNDSIEELKDMLEAQGLDREAIEDVLQEMIEGREAGVEDADTEADAETNEVNQAIVSDAKCQDDYLSNGVDSGRTDPANGTDGSAVADTQPLANHDPPRPTRAKKRVRGRSEPKQDEAIAKKSRKK